MNTIVAISFVVLLALSCKVKIGYSAKVSSGALRDSLGSPNPSTLHYGSLPRAAIISLFEDFSHKYNKVYLSSSEKDRRLNIFTENLKKYDQMNALDMGTATYGVDKFSDMTAEEFERKMLTLSPVNLKEMTGRVYDGSQLENVHIPRNFDWRKKGAVSEAKDQGFCGSCWAFSAVSNLEGLYYVKHKKLEIFSEQQLVDCDPLSSGCKYGWMADAIEYIKKAGGLELNATYPYKGVDQKCAFKKSKAVLKVKDNLMLPSRNEKKMAQYLFKNGPISVALDASALRGYQSGILHPSEQLCSKNETKVTHGVTLVGFGVAAEKQKNRKKRTPYWIVKNSWGKYWGEDGYFRIYRGDSSCAIDSWPSSAIIE